MFTKTPVALVILCCLNLALANKTDLAVLYKDDAAAIAIDGDLSESVWDEVDPITDLLVISPATLAEPAHRTVVRFFHTDQGLYVGAYAYQPPETLIYHLSSRDVRALNRDQISVTLDNSGIAAYGHYFSINLGDSFNDGTTRPERTFSPDWDGLWHGASSIKDDGWVAEFFIPWRIMTVPKVSGEASRMGLYVSRKVAYLDERWSWPALPASHGVFMSGLQPVRLKKQQGRDQSLNVQSYLAQNQDSVSNRDAFRAGFDFTWRPVSHLQLSGSLAPDFATVDNDDIVVNLGALETFFSEKRPFFLEGQTLFETSTRTSAAYKGYGRLLLVNTRRIGAPPVNVDLPSDYAAEPSDLLRPVDLYGAVKLTGQSGALRYGVLGALEEDTRLGLVPAGNEPSRSLNISGRSFGVGRLLYEKQMDAHYRSFGWTGTDTRGSGRTANVHAFDGHHLSRNGRLKLDGQLLYSEADGVEGYGAALDIEYVPRLNTEHFLQLDWFDKKLDINDLGYIIRNDRAGFTYRWTKSIPTVPSSADIADLSITAEIEQSWNAAGRLNRSAFSSGLVVGFDDFHLVELKAGYFPSRWEDLASFGNGTFRRHGRHRFYVSWRTHNAKKWLATTRYNLFGGDMGHKIHQAAFDLELRPSHRFNLELGLDYRDSDEWLVYTEARDFTTYDSDRLGVTLKASFFANARMQIGTSMQWVGIDADESRYYRTPERPGRLTRLPNDSVAESRDFTISRLVWQLRYRWEFAPLSELIIVYNHIADLTGDDNGAFSSLFADAVDDPLTQQLTFHLSYRFDL